MRVCSVWAHTMIVDLLKYVGSGVARAVVIRTDVLHMCPRELEQSRACMSIYDTSIDISIISLRCSKHIEPRLPRSTQPRPVNRGTFCIPDATPTFPWNTWILDPLCMLLPKRTRPQTPDPPNPQ